MVNPPAMRTRLVTGLSGLLPALATVALAIYHPSPFDRLDNNVYDAMLRTVPARHHSNQVAIVDVDERSLATIGQWPWRRDVVAILIERIRDAGASVVALDVVFEKRRGRRY